MIPCSAGYQRTLLSFSRYEMVFMIAVSPTDIPFDLNLDVYLTWSIMTNRSVFLSFNRLCLTEMHISCLSYSNMAYLWMKVQAVHLYKTQQQNQQTALIDGINDNTCPIKLQHLKALTNVILLMRVIMHVH